MCLPFGAKLKEQPWQRAPFRAYGKKPSLSEPIFISFPRAWDGTPLSWLGVSAYPAMLRPFDKNDGQERPQIHRRFKPGVPVRFFDAGRGSQGLLADCFPLKQSSWMSVF